MSVSWFAEAHATLHAHTKTAINAMRLADATKWNILCPTKDEATCLYMRTAESHIRCVACVRALAAGSPEMQLLGSDFPFVVGAQQTNGLLTMAGFVTAMCARANFHGGSTADDCAAACVPGCDLWHMLKMLSVLDECVTYKDAAKYSVAMLSVASHAKHSGDGDLCTAAVQHAHEAYRQSMALAVPGVSARALEEMSPTHTGTCSRVAQLFRSVMEKQLSLWAARCAQTTPTLAEKEVWGLLNSISESYGIPELNFEVS